MREQKLNELKRAVGGEEVYATLLELFSHQKDTIENWLTGSLGGYHQNSHKQQTSQGLLTKLLRAAVHGRNEEGFDFLIQVNSKTQFIDKKDEDLLDFLIYSGNAWHLYQLLEQGVNPEGDAYDRAQKQSCLFRAYDDLSMIELLVGAGADLNRRNVEGLTLLALAESQNKKEIVAFLKMSHEERMQKKSTMRDQKIKEMLEYTTEVYREPTTEEDLNNLKSYSEYNKNAINFWFLGLDKSSPEELLKKLFEKAKNTKDRQSFSLLGFNLLKKPRGESPEAIEQAKKERLDEIIAKFGEEGLQQLKGFSRYNKKGIEFWLNLRGEPWSREDFTLINLMEVLVYNARDYLEDKKTVEFLVGFYPNLRSGYGQEVSVSKKYSDKLVQNSPEKMEERKAQILALGLDEDDFAKLMAFDKVGFTPSILTWLSFDRPAYDHSPLELFDNMLFKAIIGIYGEKISQEIFNFLVSKKLYSTDKNNQARLLHLAITKGKTEYFKALMDAGFSLEGTYEGESLLFGAYTYSTAILKLLLEKGMDPNQTNRFDRSLFNLAGTDKREDVIQLLAKYKEKNAVASVSLIEKDLEKSVDKTDKIQQADSETDKSDEEHAKSQEDHTKTEEELSNANEKATKAQKAKHLLKIVVSLFSNFPVDVPFMTSLDRQWTAYGSPYKKGQTINDFAKELKKYDFSSLPKYQDLREKIQTSFEPYLPEIQGPLAKLFVYCQGGMAPFSIFGIAKEDFVPRLVIEDLSPGVRAALQNMLVYGGKLYLDRELTEDKAELDTKIELLSSFMRTILSQETLTEASLKDAYNALEQADINRGTGLYRIHSFFKWKRFEDAAGKKRFIMSTVGELAYDFKEAVKAQSENVVDEASVDHSEDESSHSKP